MSAAVEAEMSESLRRLAEPVRAGESIKALILKAARKAGMTYSRAFSLWYQRGRIRADELERVRGILRAKQQENIHAEIAELRARLQCLEEKAAMGRPSMAHEAVR